MPDHRDDRFEWDVFKSERTREERGFAFDFASLIFDAPYLRELDDRVADELRYRCTGIAQGVYLVVVVTERGERKRIISARRASRKERARYEDEYETPD